MRQEKIKRGIICPECNEPMQVKKTKPRSNAIRRQRICEHCGKIVKTREVPDAMPLITPGVLVSNFVC